MLNLKRLLDDEDSSLDLLASGLVAAANAKGGKDNISVVLVQVPVV